MTSAENACPACGNAERVCYRLEGRLFRIWCAGCGLSTDPQVRLELAQREWQGEQTLGPKKRHA